MIEVWKPVAGYEGLYEVSDLGRVRSFDRTIPTSTGLRRFMGKVLRPKAQTSGHLSVCLANAGKVLQARVHCLVAGAFIRCPEEGEEVRHRNGAPADNVATNLTYGTHAENTLDTYRHGARPTGEKNHLAKFSDEHIAKVVAARGSASSYAAGVMFGLSDGYVRELWRGEKRRHDGA